MIYKYLEFKRIKKTDIDKYNVGLLGGDVAFGEIKFDETLRRYIYKEIENPLRHYVYHLYDADCLKEITTFLDNLNKEHKEGE